MQGQETTCGCQVSTTFGEKRIELEIKTLTKSYTKGMRENGQENETCKFAGV